jgi:lycopene cyclase domain-containing protein
LFFKNPEWKNSRAVLVVSAMLFLVAGIIYRDKAYTAFTAFSNAALLLILAWRNVKRLRIFILSYIAVIPFFLLSNGILTGTGLDAPVVWYNNEENLGIRMLTIPFEDLFYGMLLILMNVAGYEWLRGRSQHGI